KSVFRRGDIAVQHRQRGWVDTGSSRRAGDRANLSVIAGVRTLVGSAGGDWHIAGHGDSVQRVAGTACGTARSGDGAGEVMMNLDSVRSPIFIPILTFPLRGGRNRRWANDCIPS